VAAEIGSNEHVKVERMATLLEKDEGKVLLVKGNITVLNGKDKTDAWEQEFVNSTWCRGVSGHDINRALYGEIEKAYGVVIHRLNGIITPPDEIELRRRTETEREMRKEEEDWVFTI
jgi:hypothetical protein